VRVVSGSVRGRLLLADAGSVAGRLPLAGGGAVAGRQRAVGVVSGLLAAGAVPR
jgi:hypothetical protein